MLADLSVHSGVGAQPWTRSNYFYHLQAGGQRGLVAININTTVPFNQPKNLVFGYDLANGEHQPQAYSVNTDPPYDPFAHEIADVTPYFAWADSAGAMHGFPIPAAAISSGTLSVDRIPNLSANKITSDMFSVDRIPDLDASKIASGQLADARMPTDAVLMKDGSAKKLASGIVLGLGASNTTVSTGLSSITAVCVTHLSSGVNTQPLGAAYNVSGGSFQIINEATTDEYFYWIAIGT